MPRFLALYMGTQNSEVQKAWDNLPEAEKTERSQRAMTEWGQWVERHRHVIVDVGAPLGKTLLASPEGIAPTRNAVAAYVIVEADTHDDAAQMFRNHPHFTIFPGTGVEIMPCLPMPSP
jgi:transcription antitermination factor NusG